ncbi:hypothetical protein FRB94_005098 [Tulasnella sp. JGI-2019a]|nr:hypothetical protein FRB94_005098 [Tulasnella sp. JGI-2019a]
MIINYLIPGDMAAALRTCRAMKRIVEACLYTHISIPTLSDYHHIRMAKLLRTLHTRPELAHKIITFDGRLYPAPDRYHFSTRVPTPVLKHWYQEHSMKRLSKSIVSLIHNMVNVKSLTLRDFHWLGTRVDDRIFNAMRSSTSLRSLTSLAVKCETKCWTSGTHENYSLQLCLVLRSHPLLERLELGPGRWDLEPWILQSDIPRLSHLTADSNAARVIVPGRPITTLYIPNLMGVRDVDTWEALAASVMPITTLAFDFLWERKASPLCSIGIYMKDVQHLVLNCFSVMMLPRITKELPSFRCLRTLRLSVLNYSPNGRNDYEGKRTEAIIRIRSICPEFQDLKIGARWKNSEN